MTCGDLEAHGSGEPRAMGNPLGLRDAPRRRPRFSKAARVEFDRGSAELCGGHELPFIGTDEHRDKDAGLMEAADGALEPGAAAGDVEAALRGEFLAALGDKRDTLRFHGERDE